MRTPVRSVLVPLLVLVPAVACGGGEAAESSDTAATSSDPADLPDDIEGLADAYFDVMQEAVDALGTVKDEESARAAAERIQALGPRVQAILEKGETLGEPLEEDERFLRRSEELAGEFQTRMQAAIRAWPEGAMIWSDAFSEGFAPR